MSTYPGMRNTIEEFKLRWPENTACLEIVCVNMSPPEVIIYYCNNRNIHIGSLLSDFAFVNGWLVTVKSVDFE